MAGGMDGFEPIAPSRCGRHSSTCAFTVPAHLAKAQRAVNLSLRELERELAGPRAASAFSVKPRQELLFEERRQLDAVLSCVSPNPRGGLSSWSGLRTRVRFLSSGSKVHGQYSLR
jgi:hypothetical protein